MNRNPSSSLLRHLLALALAALPLWSHAIEEPDYEVIRKLDESSCASTRPTWWPRWWWLPGR